MKTLSWKPKRRGNIYCAPACGHNCTYADFKKAHAGGKKLAASMNKSGLGRKWKVRVWENGGWHYCVVLGKATVHSYSHGGHWADINTGRGQWHFTHERPTAALIKALAAMKGDMDFYQTVFDSLKIK